MGVPQQCEWVRVSVRTCVHQNLPQGGAAGSLSGQRPRRLLLGSKERWAAL